MTTNDPAAIIADAIRSLKVESIYRKQHPEGDWLTHPAAALISLHHARICIEEIIRTGGRLPREALGLCKLLKSKKYRPLPYWLKKEYFEGLQPPGRFDPLSDLHWMSLEWVNPARDEDIENFAEDSAAIVFAVENSAQAAEPAKIPASTPGPDNPRPYYLNTNKSQKELQRIFCELVKREFIRGTDPGTADYLREDFLNAFDKDAAKQGRIFWIKPSIAFAFGGCNKEIKITGAFYTMEKAYEKGWLNDDDMKSIAYSYYDSHNFGYEENPYSGMYTSTEKLTKKIETELKQAYLEQIAKVRDGDRNRVKIPNYYGTYNKNVVITITSNYIFACDFPIEDEAEIGGAIFKDYWDTHFMVYHIYK